MLAFVGLHASDRLILHRGFSSHVLIMSILSNYSNVSCELDKFGVDSHICKLRSTPAARVLFIHLQDRIHAQKCVIGLHAECCSSIGKDNAIYCRINRQACGRGLPSVRAGVHVCDLDLLPFSGSRLWIACACDCMLVTLHQKKQASIALAPHSRYGDKTLGVRQGKLQELEMGYNAFKTGNPFFSKFTWD